MNDELLELFTEDGEPTGRGISRSEAHRTGAWHGSVHLWLFIRGGLALQKRSLNKESFPGMYDASAAGHIGFGERAYEATVREAAEELGATLSESELTLVDRRVLRIRHDETGFISNEINFVYSAESDVGLAGLTPCPEEIGELVCVSPEWLSVDLQAHPERYCFPPEELDAVLHTREK